MPCHHFGQYIGDLMGYPPRREMRLDLRKIRNVADMVADPILIASTVFELVAHLAEQRDGFEDGQAVAASPAEIINFT